MKISDRGLKMIAAFEGCVLHLYNDPVGLCTIGYGHLVHRGRVGTNAAAEAPFKAGLTPEAALDLLRSDVARFERCVSRVLRYTPSINEFDALVSLAFNIGESAFALSSLARELNEARGRVEPERIKWLFGLWRKAGGRTNKGLVGRRASEAAHYLSVV